MVFDLLKDPTDTQSLWSSLRYAPSSSTFRAHSTSCQSALDHGSSCLVRPSTRPPSDGLVATVKPIFWALSTLILGESFAKLLPHTPQWLTIARASAESNKILIRVCTTQSLWWRQELIHASWQSGSTTNAARLSISRIAPAAGIPIYDSWSTSRPRAMASGPSLILESSMVLVGNERMMKSQMLEIANI